MAFCEFIKIDGFIKTLNADDKVKSSKFKACESCGPPQTLADKNEAQSYYVAVTKDEAYAEGGLFTKSSILASFNSLSR